MLIIYISKSEQYEILIFVKEYKLAFIIGFDHIQVMMFAWNIVYEVTQLFM